MDGLVSALRTALSAALPRFNSQSQRSEIDILYDIKRVIAFPSSQDRQVAEARRALLAALEEKQAMTGQLAAAASALQSMAKVQARNGERWDGMEWRLQ